MGQDWIDAEFEIIEGGPRVGDPHPTAKGWRMYGIDETGRPVWRKPPRLNRWQFAAALFVGFLLFQAALYSVVEAVSHYWPRPTTREAPTPAAAP